MAKKRKKRKKRTAIPAPTQAAEAPEQRPARQSRKEEARRERERAIRAMRRREVLRRGLRWGVALLIIGLIAGYFVWRNQQKQQFLEGADAAAERLGCGEIQELPSEGQRHVQAPPTYQTKPATSGDHSGSPLPGDVHVYDQPFDPSLEFRAVHNLEHAYVLIYYRQDGVGALPEDVGDALKGLAEDESKVILAPYPELPEGDSLALAAWTRLQTCPGMDTDDADDAVAVAKGFIQRFRGGGEAPEPGAA